VAICYIFPRFGTLCQEKCGNPAPDHKSAEFFARLFYWFSWKSIKTDDRVGSYFGGRVTGLVCEKIAQNDAQSILICMYLTFYRGKSNSKLWATSAILKLPTCLAKLNNWPLGQNSPSLVTLFGGPILYAMVVVPEGFFELQISVDYKHPHFFQRAFASEQGCQIVYFKTKNTTLGNFWRVLQWKTLVYFMDSWSLYSHLAYFIDIWYIFVVIW
jgi:hypothetical protein